MTRDFTNLYFNAKIKVGDVIGLIFSFYFTGHFLNSTLISE